jgi:hypothetical protein
MRTAYAIILAGLGAVTLTGAVAAASRDIHNLNVPLPDGSTVRVEYVGNIPPKVTVTPTPVTGPLAPFGLFDRSVFDMDRQIDAMIRQVDQMARQPIAGTQGFNVASYGNEPAGSASVTIVSTSNGAQTCTQRTDVTSEGPGKAPKVVTSVSGNCGDTRATPKDAPPTT